MKIALIILGILLIVVVVFVVWLFRGFNNGSWMG